MSKRQVILHCLVCKKDFVIRSGKGRPIYGDGECVSCSRLEGDYAKGDRKWETTEVK